MIGAVLAEYLAGRLSPEIALSRLILAKIPICQIEQALPPASDIAAQFTAHRAGLERMAAMVERSSVDHTIGCRPYAIGSMFDRAVAIAPEASVAAYSLNDPVLSARATHELVTWLLAQGCLRMNADVLDLGCGIGRVTAAIAPHVRSVLGLDVSIGMIEEARSRHRGLQNVCFEKNDGAPPVLPEASFDLVVAVDSFPYIVQSGIEEAHFVNIARILRPAGRFAIMNFAYGGRASERVSELAHLCGLAAQICGEHPFTLWDGTVYLLKQVK